ncbi:hypothetical protein QBC45DRAFT_23007 [Copromyces sp. CBS 386.78]|nr:hypothetical protein QBC45DRAFT_23007 [Copromyces sp. CBS 386.78]
MHLFVSPVACDPEQSSILSSLVSFILSSSLLPSSAVPYVIVYLLLTRALYVTSHLLKPAIPTTSSNRHQPPFRRLHSFNTAPRRKPESLTRTRQPPASSSPWAYGPGQARQALDFPDFPVYFPPFPQSKPLPTPPRLV